VDPNLSEDSPQILYRKYFLRGYLNKLCSDPSKMEFWEYLDKVGMMHVGQGRAHPLHVEYVHIGVTLSFVQDIITEAVLSHPRLKMDRKIALVKALSKVIWIQNDLFAKWYVRDGDEFAEEKLVPEVEPEGYLHGRQVVHNSNESENEIEESACPFKSLATSPTKGGDAGLQNVMHRVSLYEQTKDGDAKGLPLSASSSTYPVAHSAIPRVTRESIVL
jgi:hypothetical protein